jgi:hypothetical protein
MIVALERPHVTGPCCQLHRCSFAPENRCIFPTRAKQSACGSLKRGKRRSPGRLWSHLFQPERTRNGGTALSRPRARFDICQAACVSADANIPRRSRARSQFGGRPDDHLRPRKAISGIHETLNPPPVEPRRKPIHVVRCGMSFFWAAVIPVARKVWQPILARVPNSAARR